MSTSPGANDTTRASAADAPSSPSKRRRGRVRRALLALIGLLYIVSVPWYRDTEAPLRLVMGLPDWVAVALGCYITIALLNAIAWLSTDFPEIPEEPDSGPDGAPK